LLFQATYILVVYIICRASTSMQHPRRGKLYNEYNLPGDLIYLRYQFRLCEAITMSELKPCKPSKGAIIVPP